MNRLAKQLLYGGISVAIVGGVLVFLYSAVTPEATCTDKVKNQEEEGIDCGVVACGVACLPPVTALPAPEARVIKTGASDYDVLVTIVNPNALYGASRIDYTLKVLDVTGAPVSERRGRTYANPAQPQYLVFPFRGLSTAPASAQLQFDPAAVQWSALRIDAAGDVQFAVRSDQLLTSDDRVRFDATVTNQSAFDFDQVDVTVLLSDASGQIVGAGTTVMRTLRSGEERGITVEWPFAVPGAVRARAVVTTNIFANENFIRQYGSPDQVQSF